MPLLRPYSIKPWYSADEIPSAALWEEVIRKGLESSGWFAVVLSPHAKESQWVQAEVAWAIENRTDRIVPILIGDCTPSDVHLRLIRYQYVDFRKNTDHAKRDLLAIWGVNLTDVALKELSITITYFGREEEVEQRKLLISDALTIGPAPMCGIKVNAPSEVSGIVAFIKTSAQDAGLCLLLYDLTSGGSLKVNGTHINRPWRLKVGDVVSIADVSIVVDAIRKIE